MLQPHTISEQRARLGAPTTYTTDDQEYDENDDYDDDDASTYDDYDETQEPPAPADVLPTD